ncbi:hypothetical protein [Bacillus atrophaeus]|uniref:hypothetical protein n=1 Tax=Bacillus atrophaeus TaxID=1452 RepID=UPI00227EE283|nr:hypothetical protein [Bacillus atrophaeus]MCY8988109.1 hypothetical protein [Bacillus atrophaeus]
MGDQKGLLLKGELENRAVQMGFALIEGDMDVENQKILLPSQKVFLDFHKHVDNNLLFYTYDYEDKENYYIPEDFHNWFEDSEIQCLLSEKINEYNKKINEIDFEQPSELLMFYVKDGFVFYHSTIRDEILDLFDGETMADSFIEEVRGAIPEEKLNEIKMNQQKELEQKTQEIKAKIFKDPEFKKATNNQLRKSYSLRYFDNNPAENKLLRKKYFHPNLFIEEIWREFKSKDLHK